MTVRELIERLQKCKNLGAKVVVTDQQGSTVDDEPAVEEIIMDDEVRIVVNL
jgi:hypothetical protein